MPQVPYVPEPTERPREGTGAGPIGVATPGAAFGTTVASAVREVGGDLNTAGGEIYQRAIAIQTLRNETEAKEADAKYMMDVGMLHADYSAKQGQDAVKAFPGYVQSIQDLRQKYRTGLSNDMARRMFDSSSLSTMSRTIFNGAGHSATQNKEAALGAAKSQMDLDIKTISDNPTDELLFNQKVQRVEQNAKQIATLRGFDEGGAQEKDLVLKATSHARMQMLLGLARTQPFLANEMLDKYKTQLTTDDYLHVDQSVRANGRAVGAANIAQDIFKAGLETPDKAQKALSVMEDEAREKAKALNPGDPLLEQHAVAALRGLYNQDLYAKRQEDVTNRQIVFDAIQKGVKDERELRLDPKVNSALNALAARTKLNIDVPGMINRYNAARDKTTNDDEMTRLIGLRNTDPAGFLDVDPTKLRLSQTSMQRILQLQHSMREKPDADPQVLRAYRWVRAEAFGQLSAVGLDKRTKDNADDFDHFMGSLQTGLEAFKETHNKQAGPKDVMEDILPRIMQQKAIPWGFGLFNEQKPRFRQSLSEMSGMTDEQTQGYVEQLKDQVRKRMESQGLEYLEPSEEQIRQAYLRGQFIKLYQGSAKKADQPTATVPQSK